ncbi:hypothetical protein, partial [Mesorhizobium sp. M2D.F.Ca.ET.223.01.1.1]|uniref:hypothetical protein n=1 Tax=Mesorhizobium sp. M2D.F.Ca.ET.223.01.1.1 TaxID=2563940 RepID=UPI001AEDF52C
MGNGSTRTPQFIGQSLRNAVKLECISAAAERAQARAFASAGQTPGWRSARHSTIENESQIGRA